MSDNPFEVVTEEELAEHLQRQAVEHEAKITKSKTPKPKAVKPPKEPKAVKEPRVAASAREENGYCNCGCGKFKLSTTAKFIPGHDSIAKSMLTKVQRGTMKKEDLPAALLDFAAREWADRFPELFPN